MQPGRVYVTMWIRSAISIFTLSYEFNRWKYVNSGPRHSQATIEFCKRSWHLKNRTRTFTMPQMSSQPVRTAISGQHCELQEGTLGNIRYDLTTARNTWTSTGNRGFFFLQLCKDMGGGNFLKKYFSKFEIFDRKKIYFSSKFLFWSKTHTICSIHAKYECLTPKTLEVRRI